MSPIGRGKLSVKPLPGSLQVRMWRPAVSLQVQLEQALGAPVHLWLTDNRRSMISIQTEEDGSFRIRLHHMYAEAGPAEVAALGELASGRDKSTARAVLRDFTARNTDRVRTKEPNRRVRVKTLGSAHDLAQLLERVQTSMDEDTDGVAVSWGRWGHMGPLSHVRLGSYCRRRKLIRIHPMLDRPDVPAWVIEFVLFHELLHKLVPTQRRGDKRVEHGADFKRREQAHPDYRRFSAWCKTDLQTLMSNPTGKNNRKKSLR